MNPGRARHNPVLRAAWLRLQALRRGEDGVSAIEFALIAPMLFLSLLAMTDVGLALNDRMTVDHVLRAGAQPAMRDAGAENVLAMLEATACQSYTVPVPEEIAACDAPDGADPIALQVDRFCICPATETTAEVTDPTCTSTCAVEPTRFYELSAAKTYQPMFLPDMEALNFQPSVLVQVR